MSVNGFVTFGQPLMDNNPKAFPTEQNIPMIAPFWADIDLTDGLGKIFFQEYNRITDDYSIDPIVGSEQQLFNMAERHIQNVMGDTGFYPTAVTVITWQAVSPYPSSQTYANEVTILDTNNNTSLSFACLTVGFTFLQVPVNLKQFYKELLTITYC